MRTERSESGSFNRVGKDLSEVQNNAWVFCRISIVNMLTIRDQCFILDDFFPGEGDAGSLSDAGEELFFPKSEACPQCRVTG